MEISNLFELFEFQLQQYSGEILLHNKGDEIGTQASIPECIAKRDLISQFLLSEGYQKGDKIGILSYRGSIEWFLADMAIQQLDMIPVPIHSNYTLDEMNYVFKDAAIQFCFVSSVSLVSKFQQLAVSPEYLILKETDHEKSITKIFEVALKDTTRMQINEARSAISNDDVCTIIYTSGSTGNPKGVMLTHNNILSNIKSTTALLPIKHGDVAISFLPMSHIFERMVCYAYFYLGVHVYFLSNNQKVVATIKKIRPHYFTVVPKVLENIYDLILDSETKNLVKFKLIEWAYKVGEQYGKDIPKSFLYNFQLWFVKRFIFRPWRKAMGGRIKVIMVGAAALEPKIGRLFSAAGMQVREGYGMTETSPVIAFNRWEKGGFKFGTVGKAVPDVEIKIEESEDELLGQRSIGEILVKGPNVMAGYYNQKELSKSVFDNGWFKTGDMGRFTEDGFLVIEDRKKNYFKTSGGRYVAPQPIEQKLLQSVYIKQAMIIGFKRPAVAALIIPDVVKLKTWCAINDIHWTSITYMIHHLKVLEFYNKILNELNSTSKKHEKVLLIRLIEEEWTIENEMLTPTLKLKRLKIKEKYKKQIDDMYESKLH